MNIIKNILLSLYTLFKLCFERLCSSIILCNKPGRPEISSCSHIYERYPLDITLHAADDEGRTEEPTEHRKRKAREEEGRVFLTQELPQAAVVLFTFSTIALLSWYYIKLFRSFFIRFLENPASVKFSAAGLTALITEIAVFFLKFIAPLGGVAVLAAVFFSMVQTGFHFSTKQLSFNFKKIIPTFENFRKKTVFSKTQLLNIVKIIVKVFIIILIAYWFISRDFRNIVRLVDISLPRAFTFISWLVFKLVAVISVAFLILAIPDYFIQKMEYEESLKMTKQELKQETKELEGNPEVKQKQRERAREYANRKMMGEVKNADVVITNPEHFACAIKYVPHSMHAPQLTAKGMDLVAQKIKELARENNVPQVENVPLARALYRTVEINDFIPQEFFGAVAEILSQLEKFKHAAA